MKEIVGFPVAGGRYSWSFAQSDPRPHPQGVRVQIYVHSSQRDSALSIVATNLADLGETWAQPAGPSNGVWVMDLSELATRFAALDGQTWLTGRRLVVPDFDIVNHPSLDPAGVIRIGLLPRAAQALTSLPLIAELAPSLDRFYADHTDPTRCGFLMMPFDASPMYKAITECVRRECAKRGAVALRADDRPYSQELLPNIRTYMHGCAFGIAVFDRLMAENFSPNIAFEVGYMLALGKPVCILKDATLRSLPTDLVGRLYEKFDVQRIEDTLPPVLYKWLGENRLGTWT